MYISQYIIFKLSKFFLEVNNLYAVFVNNLNFQLISIHSALTYFQSESAAELAASG